MIRAKRVKVPEFKIFSKPIVRLLDIKSRKFRLIDILCPVCGLTCPDSLLGHIYEMNDDAHTIYLVCEI